MKIHRHQLARYIADKSTAGSDTSELVKKVAAYLLQEQQTDDLASLMRDVARIRADRGHVEATAVSAHKLSGEVIRDIEQLIQQEFPKATTVTVSTRIEHDMVGGVLLELPDEQLDLTVRRKLATFRHLTDAIKE